MELEEIRKPVIVNLSKTKIKTSLINRLELPTPISEPMQNINVGPIPKKELEIDHVSETDIDPLFTQESRLQRLRIIKNMKKFIKTITKVYR